MRKDAEASLAKGPTKREVELKQLKDKLKQIGLKIYPIKSDGHCLYGSIAHQMNLRKHSIDFQSSSNSIRIMAADEMKNNPTKYQPFLDNVHTIDDYNKYVDKV